MERQSWVSQFNATTAPYPEHQPVHALFEAHAAALPDSPAVLLADRTLTYRQLNEKANQVAHAMLARGVAPESFVGVLAERGVDALISYLGILKAGAAYVPLDPRYPQDRLAFILRDSNPAAVISAADKIDQGAQLGIVPLTLEEASSYPTGNPVVPGITSRNLAYVMYTSGSTGQPKGVMIEHRSIVRLVCNTNYAVLGTGDCIAHCSSPSFDASTWEIWAALLNGARLLIVPHCVLMNPSELDRMLRAHSVTAMFMTTGLLNEYVDHLESAFGGLRYLLTGGDVLDPGRVLRLLSKPTPPANLINVYGPTETTTYASFLNITTDAQRPCASRIGRPIANTTIYILNDDGQACPPGIAGEICIGGPGVARGYLNQPVLTAARFIPDTQGDTPGERLYRSGDIGRWSANGEVEFLGRRDTQVKIRGFRVELGEIEEALRGHSGVQQALVIATTESAGLKQLIAYVVRNRTDAPPDSEKLVAKQLRNYLRARLPFFMVPSAVVVLPSLPLTENGKVDRRALPPPTLDAFTDADYVEPEGFVEQTLASLWKNVLGVERVGRSDDFFELGGNSLLAMKLALEIDRELGVSLSTQNIIDNGAFTALASSIVNEVPRTDRQQPVGELTI